ncbi:MAG TPA: protein kinase [Pyrinomonadaceae bacterium]|nr:protein kinase [Pyrinomonadaceae bacterium]
MPLDAGITLGRYEICSLLGAGGMAEVYLASDTRLERKVALKILPAALAGDDQRMNRFVLEAKAASALNHPNIITIYEIGEHDNTHFIATEYIAGVTLSTLAGVEPLDVEMALEIAVQVAAALAAAHSANIVHRDVKPENVMIRPDGLVKLLDFGIAKLTEKQSGLAVDSEAATMIRVRTGPNMIIGTASYMSPEQARGQDVDERTDIFSFGVVLYEILAGRLPFEGENAVDMIASILKKEPAPLNLYRPRVPRALQQLIGKCLRKDPAGRYQTAQELLNALKEIKQDVEAQNKLEATAAAAQAASETETRLIEALPTEHAPHARATAGNKFKNRKLAIASVALILLAAIAGLGIWYFGGGSPGTGQIESIAVLPFVNESGSADVEYLSEGMTETLISSLSQLPRLNVKARSSVFRYKGKDVALKQIGRELSVQAILNGRVVQRGQDLILNVELVDARTENILWSANYKRMLTDLISLQSEIARDVSHKLQARLSGADERKVTKNYTASTEAYQLYLKGRFYWNRRTAENLKKAIEQFRAAAERDPNYAPAYVGLADCYVLLEEYAGTPSSETLPQAKAYAERALQIDESLAEAHASLGYINNQMWQWAEAEQEFKRAIELNPNYPTAHHWYCLYLRDVGRFDDSIAEIKRAQELDPLSIAINGNVAQAHLLQGDVNAAAEQSRKMIELNSDDSNGHYWLGRVYLKQGRNSDAIAELQKAVELDRASSLLRELGYACAVTGKRSEALAIIKELEQSYTLREAIGQDLATVYAGLGERDKAFAWLEKDFQVRSGQLAGISWYSPFETLRDDPRYADLMRRMNLRR